MEPFQAPRVARTLAPTSPPLEQDAAPLSTRGFRSERPRVQPQSALKEDRFVRVRGRCWVVVSAARAPSLAECASGHRSPCMTTKQAKWAARVSAWRSSNGQTAPAFCKGKEFSPGGLRDWSSRLSRGEVVSEVQMARGSRGPGAGAGYEPDLRRGRRSTHRGPRPALAGQLSCGGSSR